MILLKYWGHRWQVGCLVMLSVLQACAIANPKGAGYAPDSTITNAVSASAGEPLVDENLGKDGKIIRNLVANNALSTPFLQEGMLWENSETGSRGVISSIKSVKEGERTCRAFKTTREAFDGVMVYEGKACDTPNGDWILSHFNAQ